MSFAKQFWNTAEIFYGYGSHVLGLTIIGARKLKLLQKGIFPDSSVSCWITMLCGMLKIKILELNWIYYVSNEMNTSVKLCQYINICMCNCISVAATRKMLIQFVILFTWVTMVLADTTAIVYCAAPVTGAQAISFNGGSQTPTYFPRVGEDVALGNYGYECLIDGAVVKTSTWTRSYISITSSTTVVKSSVRVAAFMNPTGVTAIGFCASSFKALEATTTHYTVYAPTGDIDTIVHTVTATKTATITSTTVESSTVTKTLTTVLLGTITFTETGPTVTSTFTVENGDQNTVTDTLTITMDGASCPADNLETITITDATTVTRSITYEVGTGSQLTIYTSGSVPGTSTFYSCFR